MLLEVGCGQGKVIRLLQRVGSTPVDAQISSKEEAEDSMAASVRALTSVIQYGSGILDNDCQNLAESISADCLRMNVLRK